MKGNAGWIALALLAAGLLVYWNGLRGPFLWDDPYLIINNHLIQDPKNVWALFTQHLYYGTAGVSNFYRPMQSLLLMAEFPLWKLNPFGYHLTSVAVHILCAIAAFGLWGLLFGRPWVAAGAAALFLLHPINSTVVNYISSRADSQAALFEVLALWFFAKATGLRGPKPGVARSGGASASRGDRPSRPRAPMPGASTAATGPLAVLPYIISLVCFAIALLSKEMAVAFPLLLLVSVLILDKKLLPRTLPYIGLLGLYLVLRMTVLNFASSGMEGVPPLETRLLTTTESFTRLIGSFFVPIRIHVEKNIPFAVSLFEPRTGLSLLALAGIAAFMVWVRRRSTLCFFGLAWFFVTLLPMANILPINATIADHWLYLPSVGFFLALVGGVADALQRLPEKTRPVAVKGAAGLLALCLLACAGLTVRQNRIWLDPERFFQLALVYHPGSFRARNELGVLYLEKKEWNKAVQQFEAALTINPAFDQAYDNLGVAYDYLRQYDKAIAQYLESLKHNPGNPKTYNNLGNAYLKTNRMDEAIEVYQKALQLNPGYKAVYNNLGAVYYARGQLDLAEQMWRKALEIDPNFVMASDNLKILAERRAATAP